MTQAYKRTQWLLALAALGATGMFLGGDDWFGIDLGPVGAAVLYTALWLLAINLGMSAGEAFPEDFSPAEKQAWVALVFVTLIALHVANLLTALPELGGAADQLRNPATRPFVFNLGLLIFGWIGMAGILRHQDKSSVPLDERDLRIHHQAARLANGAMTLLIIWLVVALIALPELSRIWLRPLIAANGLIALLTARMLVENIYTVWRYRRARA